MKFIIGFLALTFSGVVSTGTLPCDLVRKDPSYSIGLIRNSKGFCSGVLLSPHLVLTAGHCAKGEAIASLKFSLSASPDASQASVEKFILHPSYWKARDGSSGGLDLAILVLQNTAYGEVPDYFLPLLNSDSLTLGTTMISWGFGLQDGGDKAKRHKKEVVFSARDHSISSEGRKINSARLVFHRGETGEIQCSGDSGGPVLFNDGQWSIVGINSRSGATIKYSSKQGLKRKLASKEYFCHHSDKFMSANITVGLPWIYEAIRMNETYQNKPRCLQ